MNHVIKSSSSRRMSRAALAVALCFILSPQRQARAEFLNSSSGQFVSTTFTGGISLAGLVSLMSLRLTNAIIRETAPPSRDVERRVGLALELYLRQNSLQLNEDLALGDGPMVQELASFFELPSERVPRFGQLLQENQAELAELARCDRLTPERALAFRDRLVALVAANPDLIGPRANG